MKSDVLTVKEAAIRLGIGLNQAYEACQRQQIPCVRFGRRWLIPTEAFENWLSTCGFDTRQGSRIQESVADNRNLYRSSSGEEIQ